MSSTPRHGGLIEIRNINLSGRMSRIDFTSPFCRIPRGQTLQQLSKITPKKTSLTGVFIRTQTYNLKVPPWNETTTKFAPTLTIQTESYPHLVEFMDNKGDFNETSLILYTQTNQNYKNENIS